MDETWIHHFTPESNRLSAQWTVASENHPKQPKMQTSVGNFLASLFWDAQGILSIDYLEKRRTIALLMYFKEENAKKWPQMKKEKCSFTKTIRHVTSRSQQWRNYMNCTSNCFHTHPILHIWAPATIGCLQTSKECSRKEIWLQ